MKSSVGFSALVLALFLIATPAFATGVSWFNYSSGGSWSSGGDSWSSGGDSWSSGGDSWSSNHERRHRCYYNCTVSTNPVPEPTAALVFAVGTLVIGGGIRRSRRSS
jgi:hypothetical protein